MEKVGRHVTIVWRYSLAWTVSVTSNGSVLSGARDAASGSYNGANVICNKKMELPDAHAIRAATGSASSVRADPSRRTRRR